MDDTHRGIMDMYLTEAVRLRECTVLSSGYAPEIRLNVSVSPGQGTQVGVAAPDNDPFVAFATQMRKFISVKESVFFERVARIVFKVTHDTHKDLCDHARRWMSIFETIRKRRLPVRVMFEGKELTANHCLDLYLNGEVFHADAEKVRAIERLRRSPAIGFFYFLAKSTLAEFVHPVLGLELIIREYQRRTNIL